MSEVGMVVSLVLAGAITLGCQQFVGHSLGPTLGTTADVAPARFGPTPASAAPTAVRASQAAAPAKLVATPIATTVRSSDSGSPPPSMAALNPPPVIGESSSVEPIGWSRYESSANRFSLALPADWKVTDLSPASVAGSLAALDDRDPFQAQAAAEIGRVSQTPAFDRRGVTMYAFGSSQAGRGGFALVRAERQPLSGSVPLDVATTFVIAQIQHQADVAGFVARRPVLLPAGPAAELQYQTMLSDNMSSPRAIVRTQYLVIKGQSIYTVQLSTAADGAADFAPIFERIAQGLRLS